MFERFLQHKPDEEPSAQPAAAVNPARPAPIKVSQLEPEENAPAENEPLPEVRTQPMSDSLNPEARPPMARQPLMDENVVEESADEAEEDLPNGEIIEEYEEEDPATALPVDDEPDMTPPPAPPSFLKAPPVPPMRPTAPVVEEEPDEQETSEEIQEEPFEKSDVSEQPESESEEVEQEEAQPAPESEPESEAEELESTSEPESPQEKAQSVSTDGLRVVRGNTLHEVNFADIWYTPEGVAYVRDEQTHFALTPIETGDLEDFHRALEQGFTGGSSYAIKYCGDTYRVERVNTSDGLQYNCRKMPTTTPEIEDLGFAAPIVKHMTSLGPAAGLLLFAGPTGQGKTTTASALMKRFLDKNGGFLYTIEDPPEMPLAGVYHAANGGLGLCKQVPVENDQWGPALRSALRSKPRYILVGEIRTPETASQCLVAATSGHLVISTIHANGVEDALNSMIKYAASTGLAENLAADLLSRGILGVVHQRLEGTTKLRLIYQTAFANPNAQAADQMRMTIRDKNINLATFMEQQRARMERGLPMFRE